ncbi:transmembrane protein 14C isoform X2 [Monomorium pharaonis]|uniref:transmembrane protein 14C isoform X2 n=1 Tax=Monomorium pharaonis TaxID=307658 RepID=UPI00063F30CE|nr:transmembrane protein 14C isoform X2 [Monomorium pharaonis]
MLTRPADSIPSLAAGLLFGSVLGYGAYQLSQEPTNIAVFLGTSTALGGLMGYRFYNSGKIMPAGAIAILSAIMVVRTVTRYLSPPLKTE